MLLNVLLFLYEKYAFDYQVGRGKHPKQVYVMMMCKLVKYACLQTDKPFDAAVHKKRLDLLVNA